MKSLFKILAVMAILLASVSAYAVETTDFGPYEGKVVDADTKKPIEGVVVLVEWWQIHTGNSSIIDAQETVTDENGEFHLPGIRVFSPWKRSYSEALLTIYKSGYKYINTGVWKQWGQLKPSLPYVLKVEDGEPIFMLNRFTDLNERKYYGSPDIPLHKMKLLINEINKERKFMGLDEIYFAK